MVIWLNILSRPSPPPYTEMMRRLNNGICENKAELVVGDVNGAGETYFETLGDVGRSDRPSGIVLMGTKLRLPEDA